MSSWPNDVAGLVEQLNEWHRDELILHNEPDLLPNQKPSGETGAGSVLISKSLINSVGTSDGLVVFFLYCLFIVVIWNNHGDSGICFSGA